MDDIFGGLVRWMKGLVFGGCVLVVWMSGGCMGGCLQKGHWK